MDDIVSQSPETLGLAFPCDTDWIISFFFDDLTIVRRRVSSGSMSEVDATEAARSTLPRSLGSAREWSGRRAGDRSLV